MIYIGILDTSKINPSDGCVISKIPEEARGRVEKTKIEKEKAARAGAYLMLPLLCGRAFGAENIQICYTGKGKPYIIACDNVNNSSQTTYNISLSHDGDVAAVLITDGQLDVGIDVQSLKENVNIGAVSKRFFRKSETLAGDVPEEKGLHENLSLMGEDVLLSCFDFIDGRIVGVPCSEFLNEDGSVSEKERCFLGKWTYLESALKMSGEGFAALNSFDKIIEGSVCRRLDFFKRGKYYSLTAILKRKNEPNGNRT